MDGENDKEKIDKLIVMALHEEKATQRTPSLRGVRKEFLFLRALCGS